MTEDQLEQEVGIEGVSMRFKNKGPRLSPEAYADQESPVRRNHSMHQCITLQETPKSGAI